DDRMCVAARFLSRLEAAAEGGAHADRVEIVPGHDLPGDALGPVARGEGGAGDLVRDEGLEERAGPAQVDEVGPRETVAAGVSADLSDENEHPILAGDQGIGAQEDPFDPARDGGIGSDPEREAEDREQRESRVPSKHAETEADVLRELLEPETPSHLSGDLLDQRDVAELPAGILPGVRGRLPGGDTIGFGHAQVRRELLVQLLVPGASAARQKSRKLHGSLSAGGARSPAIAPESCSHRDLSEARSLRPAAVRR